VHARGGDQERIDILRSEGRAASDFLGARHDLTPPAVSAPDLQPSKACIVEGIYVVGRIYHDAGEMCLRKS